MQLVTLTFNSGKVQLVQWIIALLCLSSTPVLADTASKDGFNPNQLNLSEGASTGRKSRYILRGIPATEIKIWCKQIAKDGRQLKLFSILGSNIKDIRNCPACKPFFKLATGACKPPRPKKSKKKTKGAKEKTVVTVIKQREPSTLVLDITSRVFGRISRKSVAKEVKPAMDILYHQLISPKGKSPGEQDYFVTLAEYMISPFARIK